MEPEEGTPLWRLQKLPAELGLQVRRAQAAAALGRGLWKAPRASQALSTETPSQGWLRLPWRGGGRGVISCGRPRASSKELRRPRLGAPHPHPSLELPLEGLCGGALRADSAGPRPLPGGVDPSAPRLGPGPSDPGLECGAAI